MSELSFSGTPKKTTRLSSFLSDFLLFFSFLRSHPLYLSYFVFFSPYFLKLLSFLSPLFITTSLLLLLGFLTIAHDKSPLESNESKVGFIISTCRGVFKRLVSSEETTENSEADALLQFEELEAYKVVFDTSSFYAGEVLEEIPEPNSEVNGSRLLDGHCSISSFESTIESLEEKTVEIAWEETTQKQKPAKEAEKLEEFLKVLDKFERNTCNVEEEKKVDLDLSSFKSDKAEANQVEEVADKLRDDSKATLKSKSFHASACMTSNFWDSPSSRTMDSHLGSYGSMRKEKEWRRTLACKLYEERHNAGGRGGEEDMDLLWETYEADSSEKSKPKSKINNKSKSKKRGEFDYFKEEDEEEDEEEEEDMEGQLCCLQALKFSAGKMRRPNLMKISKAFKGIGWLHHVTKNGKKR